jgi:transcription-repair coupling factor (superfamily II helicase)
VDERVRFYRRLAGAPTIESVDAVADELKTTFGELPEPGRNLVDIARIRALAAEAGATQVTFTRNTLTFAPISIDAVQNVRVTRLGGTVVERGNKITRPVARGERPSDAAIELLGAILASAR